MFVNNEGFKVEGFLTRAIKSRPEYNPETREDYLNGFISDNHHLLCVT